MALPWFKHDSSNASYSFSVICPKLVAGELTVQCWMYWLCQFDAVSPAVKCWQNSTVVAKFSNTVKESVEESVKREYSKEWHQRKKCRWKWNIWALNCSMFSLHIYKSRDYRQLYITLFCISKYRFVQKLVSTFFAQFFQKLKKK